MRSFEKTLRLLELTGGGSATGLIDMEIAIFDVKTMELLRSSLYTSLAGRIFLRMDRTLPGRTDSDA